MGKHRTPGLQPGTLPSMTNPGGFPARVPAQFPLPAASIGPSLANVTAGLQKFATAVRLPANAWHQQMMQFNRPLRIAGPQMAMLASRFASLGAATIGLTTRMGGRVAGAAAGVAGSLGGGGGRGRGGDPLASTLARLGAIIGIISVVGDILHAAGFDVFLDAVKMVAQTLGGLLLPIMTAISAAVLRVGNAIWNTLAPSLDAVYENVFSFVEPAIVAFTNAGIELARVLFSVVIPSLVGAAVGLSAWAKSLMDHLAPLFAFIAENWKIVLGGIGVALLLMTRIITPLRLACLAIMAVVSAILSILPDWAAEAVGVSQADIDDIKRGAPSMPDLKPIADISKKIADAIPAPGAIPGGPGGGPGAPWSLLPDHLNTTVVTDKLMRAHGVQTGFKGISDAWKQAQQASFQSPLEAERRRREIMMLEAMLRTAKAVEALPFDHKAPSDVHPWFTWD